MRKKKTMRMKKFYSKSTAYLSDALAQKYGNELEHIKAREGELTPKNILRNATSPRNPLHKWFDWKDDDAAKRWRHQQAIHLVSLVAEVIVIEGKRTKQRSFFGIKGGRSGVSYVTIDEVRSNKNYREKLISDVIKHLENTKDLLQMLKRY